MAPNKRNTALVYDVINKCLFLSTQDIHLVKIIMEYKYYKRPKSY